VTNLEYILARDALIPTAENFANVEVGKFPQLRADNPEFSFKWNRAFHTKMNELAKEKGLVNVVSM
jgi:hypothetical protein